jgi:hypothetical protein
MYVFFLHIVSYNPRSLVFASVKQIPKIALIDELGGLSRIAAQWEPLPRHKTGGSNIHMKVLEKIFFWIFSPRKHEPSFCGEPNSQNIFL